MILNATQPASTATRPRGMVIVNGEVLQGLVSFEVDNNSYFQADTFRLTLCLSVQAANRDAEYWSNQTSLQVELLVGHPQDPGNFTRTDLKSLLVGYADDIEIDPLRDEVTFSGRDLTSLLIDAKPTESYSTEYVDKSGHKAYRNISSSDIVTRIARAVGLSPAVVPTKVFSGTMAGNLNQVINDRGTYWDIITKLAQVENYSVWVSGRLLNFAPRASVNSLTDVYAIRYQAPGATAFPIANVCAVKFSRNLSVSRGVTVTVRSFDQKARRPVVATANRAHVKNRTTQGIGVTGLPPANYLRLIQNADTLKCQKVANAMLADISEKEMNLEADMPGDDLLTPQVPIQVIGSGMAFDQIYYPQSIQRRYSFGDGYRMIVRACNVSPDMGIQ